MGFMDALKKLTKPYEDDSYLDEGLEEQSSPSLFPRRDTRDYTAYAEAPQAEEPAERKSFFSSALHTLENAGRPAAPAPSGAPAAASGAPMKLLVVKPLRFEDAAGIADQLKARNSVVLNIENTPKDEARRLVDFISGFTYAMDGRVRRIAAGTYIVTPTNVELMSGDLSALESNEINF